ncbi:hypothetical protein FN846DRAFT_998732 [Sphaerosporella brunnea]|uniref:Uncharacterized protein n=1 Tax=Sphaerosporella brunnea TaxID=1250544 RepID=A0A5J5EIT7_9PEZI|nr:hypothetical protein FN846DRAFT_998732 [Sphaerosporella brunnea]
MSTAEAHVEKHGRRGPDAVLYKFVAVGEDPGAERLLASLDDDPLIGDYIDCIYNQHLEEMYSFDTGLKWGVSDYKRSERTMLNRGSSTIWRSVLKSTEIPDSDVEYEDDEN